MILKKFVEEELKKIEQLKQSDVQIIADGMAAFYEHFTNYDRVAIWVSDGAVYCISSAVNADGIAKEAHQKATSYDGKWIIYINYGYIDISDLDKLVENKNGTLKDIVKEQKEYLSRCGIL